MPQKPGYNHQRGISNLGYVANKSEALKVERNITRDEILLHSNSRALFTYGIVRLSEAMGGIHELTCARYVEQTQGHIAEA
jgi:hypothetical protein